jgi:hypothetical protein
VSRILITGGPRTGKTTRANASAGDCGPIRHTDDLIATHGWSEASEVVAGWFDAPGPWVIEGVAVPRALRKWLRGHADGTPCDVVLLLEHPHVPLVAGQAAMAKGLWTVWSEIEGELAARGVRLARE